MSFKTWLLGSNAGGSKRTTMHFYDDESFEFRRLPIKDTFFILKQGERVVSAWCHFFKTQFNFTGYRSITGDAVTITHERDILYDPYNILGTKEKPNTTGELNQEYIARIANTKIHEAQKQKKKSTMMDKVTYGLLAVVGVEVIVLLLKAVSCSGGGK